MAEGEIGGFGSGRHGGRPTIEDGLSVNLPLMFRKGWIREGWANAGGSLTWSRGGQVSASIGYTYNLADPDDAWLKLQYRWTPAGGEPREIEQFVRLVFTRPNFGGRRWWMICPFSGRRVAKLHLPPGGGKFASREAWRLSYRSQRLSHRDRPFEKLFRQQRKLGSRQGWETPLTRPKGMWQRTYDRHWERYWELDGLCAVEAMRMLRLST